MIMFKHGKDTVVKVGATDLSAFTNSTDFNNQADALDVTTYGHGSKVYAGGLKDGKVTLKGTYDDGTTGPRAILKPLLGTSSTFTFQPEGTGAGLPQTVVDVVITAYNESSPVAEMIQWTCEMQMSDDANDADQA